MFDIIKESGLPINVERVHIYDISNVTTIVDSVLKNLGYVLTLRLQHKSCYVLDKKK